MEKILIARAPVRISFGGGGTDMPGYYEQYGGLVVSATIGYYVYTILTPTQSNGLQMIYADHQAFSALFGREDLTASDDLGLPKAIAYHFNVRSGMGIFLASQIPPGTGLGLSGSVAVSMIKALAFCCGLDLGPKEVAELACYIEIEKMGMPVGKQDQYAAAFGGLNSIAFSKSGIVVHPLRLSPDTYQALEEGTMLFCSRAPRQSFSILKRQKRAIQEADENTMRRLDKIKGYGLQIRDALEAGDLDAFGELLHRSWLEKRALVEGIANSALDYCYQVARENGALGGKVTGAGAGGFMLLYCPKEQQQAVTDALTAMGMQRWPLTLETEGVQILQAVPWSRQQVVPSMLWAQSGLQEPPSFLRHGLG
jgi:D-glycero-alpha-D-manno-heptose-7-phosphate kinase